jgi:hypothetical protein
MAIVTPSDRPKRALRKKRKQPAIANRIVTPAPLKPIKGPVIRFGADMSGGRTARPPKPSAIVEPKRKPQVSIFGPVPDYDPEEHQRRGEAAEALWRELVRL